MTADAAVFRAAVRAETRRLATQPWDAFVAFGLPLILLTMIAAMLLSGVIRQAPVAVVDQDNSAFSRAAIRNMQATPGIRLVHALPTVDEAVAAMRRGEVYSFAHFPAGFTAGAFRRPEQVTVSFNGAFQTVGTLAALGQTSAIAAAAAPRLEARARQMGLPDTALAAPSVQASIVGNPQLSFELFLGGLLAPGVLHLLAANSAVLAVGRLMQGGSFRAFRAATGGRTTAALIGHLTPHFIVFSLWGLAWIAWLCGFRAWGVAGSLPLLVLGVFALMAVSVALSALLVAALGDTSMAFSATAIYSGAAIAFSNGTLPLDHGPRFARVWSDILPYTHYLRLQTGQIVAGAAPGGAWGDLAVLGGAALVALIGGAIATRLRARRAPRPEAPAFPLPQRGVGAAFLATVRNLPRTRPVSSVLILAPVLYAFYYPSAYAGQAAADLPVAVVSSNHAPLTRKLVEDLNAAHAVEVAAVVPSAEQARDLMRRGVVDGVVILPERFEIDLARGSADGIAVWLNGGYLVRVTSIGRAVAAVAADVVEARSEGLPETVRAARLAPELKQVSLFNPTEGYGDYAVPAVSIIILQQTLLLGAGVIAAIRRETGAAPLRIGARLGLWMALTAIGTASGLFYFGFVFWLHDYPRAGDIAGVLALTPIFSAGVSALGLSLGGLFDRHERVLQVLVGTSAPLFFLTGVAWPHFMMPRPLVWLAHLSPSTAAAQAFVRMNAMGADIQEVAPAATTLVLLATFYGALWLGGGALSRHRDRRRSRLGSDLKSAS